MIDDAKNCLSYAGQTSSVIPNGVEEYRLTLIDYAHICVFNRHQKITPRLRSGRRSLISIL